MTEEDPAQLVTPPTTLSAWPQSPSPYPSQSAIFPLRRRYSPLPKANHRPQQEKEFARIAVTAIFSSLHLASRALELVRRSSGWLAGRTTTPNSGVLVGIHRIPAMAALGQWCPGLQLRTLSAPTARSTHPSASPSRICVYVVALHSNSGMVGRWISSLCLRLFGAQRLNVADWVPGLEIWKTVSGRLSSGIWNWRNHVWWQGDESAD